MDPRISSYKNTFGYTSKLMERFTGDLTAQELNFAADKTNSIFWIVSHLTAMRLKLCRRLGAGIETSDWEATVERGAPKNSAAFQAVAEDRERQQAILTLFRNLSAELIDRLEQLTPEALAGDVGRTMPDGSSDLAGVIGFLMQHESYHLGQISMLRVQLGKPAIP